MLRLEPGDVVLVHFLVLAFDQPETDEGVHLVAVAPDILVEFLDPAELDFPFQDAASFQDMEGEEALPVLPDTLRARYRELVQAHVATLRRELGSADMDYFLFDTRRPLGAALFEYLSIRERLMRVR